MVASAYHRIEVTETILRNLPPAHNGGSFFAAMSITEYSCPLLPVAAVTAVLLDITNAISSVATQQFWRAVWRP